MSAEPLSVDSPADTAEFVSTVQPERDRLFPQGAQLQPVAVQQYVDRVDGMLDRVKGGGLPEQIKMLQASDHTIWRDTVQELYKLIGCL